MKYDVLQSQASSKTLRMPHQQDAVDNLNKYFNIDNPEEAQSGLLVMYWKWKNFYNSKLVIKFRCGKWV